MIEAAKTFFIFFFFFLLTCCYHLDVALAPAGSDSLQQSVDEEKSGLVLGTFMELYP